MLIIFMNAYIYVFIFPQYFNIYCDIALYTKIVHEKIVKTFRRMSKLFVQHKLTTLAIKFIQRVTHHKFYKKTWSFAHHKFINVLFTTTSCTPSQLHTISFDEVILTRFHMTLFVMGEKKYQTTCSHCY